MPLRQEDDVARLLKESGTNGTSYRSFDNATVVKNDASALPADTHITPLISEIFARPDAAPATFAGLADSLSAQQPRSSEPPAGRPAPLAVKAPVDRSHIRAVSPPAAAAPARLPSAHGTSSLDDIRRVLEGDLEKPASGAVNGALRGIFDRLAE